MISYLLRWSSRCFLDSNFWIFFFFLSSGTFLLSFQFLREKLLLIKSCSRVEIRFKKWNSEETSTQFAIAFSSPLKCHIFQGITFVVSYEENICFIFLNLSFFFFFFKEKAPPFSNVLIFSRNSIKTIDRSHIIYVSDTSWTAFWTAFSSIEPFRWRNYF